ncbi:hypothetical protein GCM10028806_18170 [Spirosoma terrae]
MLVLQITVDFYLQAGGQIEYITCTRVSKKASFMKNVDFWKPKLIRAVQELYQVSKTDLVEQDVNCKIQFDEEENNQG